MAIDAVGEVDVGGQERGFYLAVVEDAVQELSLHVRKRENRAQGGTSLFHHTCRPLVKGIDRRQMVRPQHRNKRAAQLTRLEADVVHRYGSPVLAAHRSIDHESKAEPVWME